MLLLLVSPGLLHASAAHRQVAWGLDGWSRMVSARMASLLPRVSRPSVGSPRLVHMATGQGSKVKVKGHKTSGSSAQNWPKATSNIFY